MPAYIGVGFGMLRPFGFLQPWVEMQLILHVLVLWLSLGSFLCRPESTASGKSHCFFAPGAPLLQKHNTWKAACTHSLPWTCQICASKEVAPEMWLVPWSTTGYIRVLVWTLPKALLFCPDLPHTPLSSLVGQTLISLCL